MYVKLCVCVCVCISKILTHSYATWLKFTNENVKLLKCTQMKMFDNSGATMFLCPPYLPFPRAGHKILLTSDVIFLPYSSHFVSGKENCVKLHERNF